jgi:Antitoxin SocA-like, Panacea domain
MRSKATSPAAPRARPRAHAYSRSMALSARDVAAALRERLPSVPTKKLHKLLYYAQGHHLAVFGTPLFDESISAWDMGPVVGSLWYGEKQGQVDGDSSRLDETALNSVGYVVSRYGRLTGEPEPCRGSVATCGQSSQAWRERSHRAGVDHGFLQVGDLGR